MAFSPLWGWFFGQPPYIGKIKFSVNSPLYLGGSELWVVSGLQGDEARPDIRAKGFWRPHQNAYLDVMVTNSDSSSYQHQPIETTLKQHEQEKKRNYNDRVMNVEHGTFTPLIFTLNGSIGPEARVFHKNLAEKLSEKRHEDYDKVLIWIRTKLRFLILRACLTCIRGSRQRSIANETNVIDGLDVKTVCLWTWKILCLFYYSVFSDHVYSVSRYYY